MTFIQYFHLLEIIFFIFGMVLIFYLFDQNKFFIYPKIAPIFFCFVKVAPSFQLVYSLFISVKDIFHQ